MKKVLNIIIIFLFCLLMSGCDLFGSNPKITFNYNCEGLNDYNCQVIDNKLNCMFIMPECGEKTFVGWYDAKTSGKEVNLDADFTKSTTIYAQWKKEGEITPEPEPTPEPITDIDEEPIIEQEPVDVVYKVTFNVNGGSGGQSATIEVKYGDKMPSISKTIPTRSGYTFMGWYDNSDYSRGEAYYNELCEASRYYDRESNVILYAGWKTNAVTQEPTQDSTTKPTVEKYKVSFNANGGNGGPKESIEVTYSEAMPSLNSGIPTRKGYTFVGWYDNSDYTKGMEYYSSKQEPLTKYNKKSNITLYAGWKINKYLIKFNANGGSGGQTNNVSVEYEAMMPSINTTKPVREGYTFTGWYDNTDYTKGKAYYNEKNEAAKYFDKTSDLTLYAGWSKIIVVQKYKVTFNINGGSGTTPGIVEATIGSNMPSITTSVPTREGYTFMGWYNNKTYTKGTQYYTNKNNSARKYDIKSDTILYAGWKANVLSIRYNGNGGVWNNTSSSAYTVNSSGTIILKSNNSIYDEIHYYGGSLSSDGLIDYNGSTFNWTRSGYYIPQDKEYIINNIEVSQSKVYTAVDLAKYGGCDLSKTNCTITVKVNWKKGEIVRAATFNIGYFGCGTSKKVKCKSTVAQITNLFKNAQLDIVGIQEAVPDSDVKKVGKNLGLTNKYTTYPSNINTILSKYSFVSKNSKQLPKCSENRNLNKVVVNINGVDISFYNTHYSYQKGCPEKHMAYVAKIIKDDPNPIILTGDTNTTPITNFQKYLEPIGFTVAAHNTAARGVEGKESWCDSVFINSKGHIDVVDSTTVNIYGKLSDHNLVYATLAIY